MNKLILGIAATIGFAVSAHAQVTSSIGYTHLSDHRGVDVGAAVASIGYRVEGDGRWSFQPQVGAGIGVVDDTVRGYSAVPPGPMVDVELESLLVLGGRVQYQADGGTYFFLQPTLMRVELDGGNNLATRGLNDSDWEFGGDMGVGHMFSERIGLEASYGVLDGEPVANAALRLNF